MTPEELKNQLVQVFGDVSGVPGEGLAVQLGDLQVTCLRPMSSFNEELALLGQATICGTQFEVDLIAVANDDTGTQYALLDPYSRLETLYIGVEANGRFQTITLPHIPGDWVLYLYPHC